MILLTACTGQPDKKKPQETIVADTSIVYPTGSNVPVDTDDHNKNIFDTVPLDGPPSSIPKDSLQ